MEKYLNHSVCNDCFPLARVPRQAYYSLSFPFIKGPSKSQGISETLLFQKVINSLKQVIIDLSVIEKIVVSPS